MLPSVSPRPPIDTLLTASARDSIRAAVRDNDGGEVFFTGRVNPDGLVEEVEPYAFGNKNMVPALIKRVEIGDVIIHNHPGGNLEPSDADVAVAAQFGDMSVGCYIVDNDCTAIHVLVRAFREETIHLVSEDDIAAFFSPNGVLARSLPGYEQRPQQVDMARQVARAFNDDDIAVIEAGTGVGKSMAYLLPAILWSLRNKERVVISTNTINLQEQLIGKDLPLLAERLGLEFRAELLKGRGNYLCLRKTQFARAERAAHTEPEIRDQVAAIVDWSEKTQDGSLSDLPFVPQDEAWDLVVSETDNCLRVKCPFYSRCFFYNARRRAARADVVVVNHHLLMADLALRRETDNYTAAAILPPFRRIVFDEAHNIEAAATRHFSIRVSRVAFNRQLNRLAAHRGQNRGLLSTIARIVEERGPAIPHEAFDFLRTAIYVRLPAVRDDLENTVAVVFDELANELLTLENRSDLRVDEEIKRRVEPAFATSRFWLDSLEPGIGRIAAAIGGLRQEMEAAIAVIEELEKKHREPFVSPVMELRSIGTKIGDLAQRLRLFAAAGENHCRWFELRQPQRGPVSLSICAAPLDIREPMRRAVYEPAKTVIMTSATLAVDNKFDFFLRQVGLDA